MPVSGSTPSSSSSPIRQSGQDRPSQSMPREEQRQRDDFQRKLLNREQKADEKNDQKTEGKQRGADPRTKSRDEHTQSSLSGLKSKDEKRDGDKLAALAQHHGQTSNIADNGQIKGQASMAADIDPALQNQLERIAAAIAEIGAKDTQTKYTLQLPGSAPIESAILAKNAAGFISVLLVARPGTLDRHQRRQIRAELDEQLKSRAIKLGDIGFAGDAGDRKG